MTREPELDRRARAALAEADPEMEAFPGVDQEWEPGCFPEEVARGVGFDPALSEVAGSYLLHDRSVVFDRINEAYEGRLELAPIEQVPPGLLERYWWRAVEVDADGYTALTHLEPTGGFYLHVFPGQRIDWPLQTCMLIEQQNSRQLVHNVIVVEEGAEVRVLTGCTVHPLVHSGLHAGVTEVYLKRGASLCDTMLHHWSPEFHVRPHSGVVVGAGATYVSNYILLDPARSVRSVSRVALEGDGARAELNSIVVGRQEAMIDLDLEIRLIGKGTRAESVSRAVAFDRSQLFLRGLLVGMHDESQGHLDCRGISFGGAAEIHAIPELEVFHAPQSQLSHEAAVGPIAEEVVDYLRTRGLGRDEAIATLTTGFLNLELPGLPLFLRHQLQQMIALTADDAL